MHTDCMKIWSVCTLALLLAGTVQAEAIVSYRFREPGDLASWETGWHPVWEADNPAWYGHGTVTWSKEYGGSALMSVSGAPCIVDLWRAMPVALQYGDRIVVKFHIKGATGLRPNAHFDITLGPGGVPWPERMGQHVNPGEAGGYKAYMPIWWPMDLKSEPFGIRLMCWPGSAELYVKEISLER